MAETNNSIDIVMRSYNDMPLVVETLEAIRAQSVSARLTVFDNSSTDGTREAAEKIADAVFDVPKGKYIPGKVLNRAMSETTSELVVFINSDCTPVDSHWLENLLAGFKNDKDSKIAALFSRQKPRPDCWPLFVKDTEATFGDGSLQAAWRHCFSMASSAVRRSVWEKMPFDDTLNYSEDIDWTWRARQAGYQIRYVSDSAVYHSHNYTTGQYYRRQRGEGHAEAEMFDFSDWESSLLRYSLLPLGRTILSDWRYCLKRCQLCSCFYSPILRTASALGRRRGFRAGQKARKFKEQEQEASQ
jgi:GT2 family glycosyltransferase